ncbi:MAG: hypothetical protein SGCHY_005046, partial [Lobulomycetales sp.]
FHSEFVSINEKSFQVVRQLGEGGFSYVYLVKDPRNNAQFALKRVRIQLPEHKTMLDREIRAHAQLAASRNVIKLVDSAIIYQGSSPSEGLLLLPFYPGGTCQDLIDRSTPSQRVLLKTILSLTADICQGLLDIHAKGLAYRDLKPANVIIDEHGRAILMDLGSVTTAKVVINSRKEALALQELAGETCTAPYRAPELFEVPSPVY